MIGADAFLDILSWKSYRDVLRSVHIILSRRKGYTGDRLADLLKSLGYATTQGFWHAEDDKKDIYILARTPGEQSSSKIRAMIAQKQSVERFLPPSVMLYIEKNKLYRK
jgi:nicotinate-nucleotide adenylyltransferase